MTNDSLRGQFARRVASRCALDPTFADLFSVRDPFNRRVVVPVLDTDAVPFAVHLIQQAGGEGTLAVLTQGQHERETALVLLQVGVVSVRAVEGDWHPPVSQHCTISDLLKVLLPGALLTMQMVSGDELRIADLGGSDLPGEASSELARG